MVNPFRGEVELSVDGSPRVMRLTLGALAELEARLKCDSLLDMIARFETGAFRVRDLISLLTAGLNGGGWAITETDLVRRQIDGGPLAAAQAAAQLLKITFTLPGEGEEA
ncbi:MAG: gene transfer agent family protein [Amaricoccus sp.]